MASLVIDDSTFNASLCIICDKSLTDSKFGVVVKNPSKKGLDAILTIADKKRDTVHTRVNPYREAILRFDLKARFHTKCRSIYTRRNPCVDQDETTDDGPSTSKRRSVRDPCVSFNIRENCLICDKGNTWKEKLTCISTGTGESTRNKVQAAAIARKDDKIISRVNSCTDFFAYDVKYHRSCLSTYISERNVSVAVRKLDRTKCSSIYDEAMMELSKELNLTVFSNSMEVVELTTLTDKFNDILKNIGHTNVEIYRSWKLKERLQSFYGDSITFINRKGLTDLICSSSLNVGDAFRKSYALLKPDEEDSSCGFSFRPTCTKINNDKSVLHTAAGILRESMACISDDKDEYVAPSEFNFQAVKEFIPQDLADFIFWLLDEKAFNKALSFSNITRDNKRSLKSIFMCHQIVSICRNMKSPLTLGLTVQLHHDFGSRSLIDTLSSLGLCVTYNEVRMFLSSAAKHCLTDSIERYVPFGLEHVDSTGPMIDAAIDNFDQNEETLDGKSTTHAMAMVIYQRSDSVTTFPRIKRHTERSLEGTESIDCEDSILRYIKPNERPEPPLITNDETRFTYDQKQKACMKDILWILSRYFNKAEIKRIPSWSPFNAALDNPLQTVASIQYMPFIHASPTDLSTIYTSLVRLVYVAESLGQSHIMVTADMSIYSKAQEILWNQQIDLKQKVTMRIGGMHHLMAFIASIGKLYKDGGLMSMLTDSDVYAPATACQMLEGKQLSRAVRGLKLAMEALYMMFMKTFCSWMEAQNRPIVNEECKGYIDKLNASFAESNSEQVLSSYKDLEVAFDGIQPLLCQFEQIGRAESQTFAYWMNFLDAVQLLLQLIRAERSGNFELHLSAVADTLPWFRAAGRLQYAKFTPVYLGEMKKLKVTQNRSYKHLESGGFVVKRSSRNTFNSVSTDQALEQTINREGKSVGGVIGFTMRKGALTRWLTTRHVTGEYCNRLRNLCEVGNTDNNCLSGFSMTSRDQKDVGKIVSVLEEQFQNPFELSPECSDLVNIATGLKATKEIEKDLVNCVEKGRRDNEKFIQERLDEKEKSISFWKPQARPKIRTFADMKKAVKTKDLKLKIDSEVLFRRLLSVSRTREVSLKRVLEHELAAVPPSLFNDDGSIRKTVKSDLAKKLEGYIKDNYSSLPENTVKTAYLIDAMALIQALNDSMFKTFNDLGEIVVNKLVKLLNSKIGIESVALVFDKYLPNSVKDFERDRRTAGESAPSYIVSGTRVVPNYRRFLSNTSNKSALIVFVSSYIENNIQDKLGSSKAVYIVGGAVNTDIVKVVRCPDIQELPMLSSNQEEADTRLILHAIDLAKSHQRIIIRCDDTDVLVLLLYYRASVYLTGEIYMHAGHVVKTTNRERYIPVHLMVEVIGKSICRCLPAFHALTGCDTTSSLFRIGKKSAFKILECHIEDLRELSIFAVSSTIKVESAYKLAMYLYGNKKLLKECKTLDDMRYLIATTSDKSASLLPPTDDAFYQHALRAFYQAYIWCHSHLPVIDLPDPRLNGWTQNENGTYQPVYFEKDPAPKEVRDLTHLFCTDKTCGSSRQCQCLSAGLPCLENCKCFAECNNKLIETDVNEDDLND